MPDFIEFENFRIYDDELTYFPANLSGKVQIAQPWNPLYERGAPGKSGKVLRALARDEGLAVFTKEQAITLAKSLLAALTGQP